MLKRSESWVKRKWNVNLYDFSDEEESDEQRALSQESKEVIRQTLARPKKRVFAKSKLRGKRNAKRRIPGALFTDF